MEPVRLASSQASYGDAPAAVSAGGEHPALGGLAGGRRRVPGQVRGTAGEGGGHAGRPAGAGRLAGGATSQETPAASSLSVFEEHTRWISKGKAGAPVELGVPVAIVEDQYQFILEHRILWEGSDTDAAVPVIVATRERFPELLACSFDRGFHSPQNQVALGDRLELNAMPAKGRLSPAAAHTRRSRTSHWRASSIPPSSRQSTISSSAAWTGCAPMARLASPARSPCPSSLQMCSVSVS